MTLRDSHIAASAAKAFDAFQAALMSLHCPGGAYTLAACADLLRDAESAADTALAHLTVPRQELSPCPA